MGEERLRVVRESMSADSCLCIAPGQPYLEQARVCRCQVLLRWPGQEAEGHQRGKDDNPPNNYFLAGIDIDMPNRSTPRLLEDWLLRLATGPSTSPSRPRSPR